MTKRHHSFLVLIINVLLISQAAHSQVDPHISWKKMNLPHFELIFDASHQDLANIYAARLEGALQNLSPLFPAGPDKTAVVLDDRTDLTNGSATSFPYPVIMVYPVLPGPQESIGEYNDWAAELVTHEYTHVLAMSPQRGVARNLSFIFGSILSPNILLPRWWHEGLAVEMETRFSTAGRLRSPQQDAWLRSYVIDDKWNSTTISEANEVTIPTWPYGARPYLLGSILWSEMITQTGASAIKDLTWAHAGRFPFLINEPAKQILGSEYSAQFAKARDSVETRVNLQLQKLKSTPVTVTKSLNMKDLEGFSPALSPDGLKLAFIGKDETTRRSIRVLERPSTKVSFEASQLKESFNSRLGEYSSELRAPVPHEQDGPPAGTISRLSWFPDSQRIVFDRVDELNWYHETSDLYVYDTQSGKVERLSYGLRAREPAISPDGKSIVYIKILPGKTEIESFDLESKTSKTLLHAPLQARCSHPSFVNDSTLVFSYRLNGQENIQTLDLHNNITRIVLEKFSNANFPTLAKNRLLFTSSKNGVHNLYLSDENWSEAKPVTHSLTAIYESTWDSFKNEYYLSEQTSQGVQLARLEDSVSARPPAELPVVQPLYADRYPAFQPTIKTEVVNDAAVEDYSAWKYLLPKYWFPLYYWDSFSSYLSANTSGQDPLGKHAWSAFGIYDLEFQHTGYGLTYENTQTPALILAALSNLTVTLPGVIPEQSQWAHIESDWQITALSPYWQSGVGWTWMSRTLPGLSSNQAGPSVSAAYSNFTMTGAQISPENGMGGSLTLTSFLAGSSLINYNQAEFSFVKYWSSFLPKRHSLMTKFQSFMMDQYIVSNYAYTWSQAMLANTALPQYLMRAYPTASFQGRVLNNLTVEYRFPIQKIYRGADTTPFFMKQIHAAIIADGVNVDGIAYSTITKNYQTMTLSRSFWSVGLEARFDTTIAYQFPITWYSGVYTPIDTSLTTGVNIGFGLYL